MLKPLIFLHFILYDNNDSVNPKNEFLIFFSSLFLLFFFWVKGNEVI